MRKNESVRETHTWAFWFITPPPVSPGHQTGDTGIRDARFRQTDNGLFLYYSCLYGVAIWAETIKHFIGGQAPPSPVFFTTTFPQRNTHTHTVWNPTSQYGYAWITRNKISTWKKVFCCFCFVFVVFFYLFFAMEEIVCPNVGCQQLGHIHMVLAVGRQCNNTTGMRQMWWDPYDDICTPNKLKDSNRFTTDAARLQIIKKSIITNRNPNRR